MDGYLCLKKCFAIKDISAKGISLGYHNAEYLKVQKLDY